MRACLLAAALLSGARAAAAAASVSFEVDPRVERLSVVLLLSEPGERARDAYASAAEAAFAPFSGHPAVALVSARRREGATVAALARGDAELARALADFGRASGFDRFYKAQREAHRAYAETARRESLRALSPASALAYMGLPFKGKHRFILAPLLPDEPGLAALRVRAGRPARGGLGFGFDAFETSVAAELSRGAATWLRPPSGPLAEHVAAAVGLRVIARDLGERAYRASLRRAASGRLPRLEAVAERLKDFEAARARYPTLQAFSPLLEALAALRLEQAADAARAGERDAALALLAEALAHSPDLETGRRIMFLYRDLGEDGKAKLVADGILTAAPENTGALLDQAGLAAKAGDRAAALGFLARAGRGKLPEDGLRRAAELYAELKEYASARGVLGKLIAAAPHDPRLRVDAAVAAARTGDRPGALRLLGEAAARRPSPGDRRLMSFAHLELKDFAGARTLLDGLIRESPADADLRLDRASLAAEAGDREGALRLLGEARALSPGLQARHRLALLYQDLGDEERAREIMDALLRDSPTAPRPRIDRASHAARVGDRATALAYLAEARRMNPSLEERRLMVSLHQGLGDYEAARSLLEGLIAAAPGDPGLLVDRAALALRTEDRGAARLALAAALALDPEPADRRRMGLLHQDLKDYAAALALLEPLARARPADAGLLADLGLCRYLDGRTEDAIAALRAAIALDASSLPAILTLGSIYAAQKRFDEELAVYAAAPPSGGEPELRAALARSRRDARARPR